MPSDLRIELAVDQNEQHFARLAGSIRLGVAGPALNQKIALLHESLVVIEHGSNLAFQRQRVIDRFGTMRQGMTA